uniref:Uncharacterized protein n=1 Tax=Oryza barthii TaxID=65489 RepID=A0A0D3G4C4_9ORYZ
MAGGEHGVNGQHEETRAMEEGSRDHQARCENSEQDGGGSKSSSNNHPMFSVQFAQKRTGGTVTFPGICITWGLAVMVMVYSVGHISGAHLNPAVTLAFATCGRFPWRRVPAYAAAQVAGSAAASAALRALFGGAPEHFFGTAPAGSDVQSLAMEFIITFYLMFVVSGVATDNRAIGELAGLAVGATVLVNVLFAGAALRALFGGAPEHFFGTAPAGSDVQSLAMEFIITFYLMFVVSGVATDNRAIGELAGLAVGATVLVNVLFAGPISGASMNPARTIGPAIILGRYTGIWVYIAGPVFGAVAGAWAYNLIRFTDKPLREITMTASFIRSTRRN